MEELGVHDDRGYDLYARARYRIKDMKRGVE